MLRMSRVSTTNIIQRRLTNVRCYLPGLKPHELTEVTSLGEHPKKVIEFLKKGLEIHEYSDEIAKRNYKQNSDEITKNNQIQNRKEMAHTSLHNYPYDYWGVPPTCSSTKPKR